MKWDVLSSSLSLPNSLVCVRDTVGYAQYVSILEGWNLAVGSVPTSVVESRRATYSLLEGWNLAVGSVPTSVVESRRAIHSLLEG